MADKRRIRGAAIHRPIVYGSVATMIPVEERIAKPDHNMRWTVAVRSAASPAPGSAILEGRAIPGDVIGGCDDLSYFIKKVTFKLHESYPNPLRVVDKAPFELTETGWGEFVINITIHFLSESAEKAIQLQHPLKLHDPTADPNSLIPPVWLDQSLADSAPQNKFTSVVPDPVTSKPNPIDQISLTNDPPPTSTPPFKPSTVVHSWQYYEIVFTDPVETFYTKLLAHPPTPVPAQNRFPSGTIQQICNKRETGKFSADIAQREFPRHSYIQPHPSREQRPPSIFQSHPPSNANKNKPTRAAVPFNRLQLAAALIEYNDGTSDNQTNSGIDWSLQELISQPVTTLKQAPYSAIFIPFRQTLSSKPLDFFSGLELPSSPKSPAGKSMSGFGIVSETGASRLAQTIPGNPRRISEPVVIENAKVTGSQSGIGPFDNDVEVLSEWGLDKVLSGNLETPKSPDSAQEPKPHPKSELRTGRVPENLNDRHQVQSDMFDFHFSELRLHNEEEEKAGKSLTPDFFDDKNNPDELNLVIDDEALLRQRVGCDPEGRKLLRPQSVMELKETRLRYRQNKTSTTKQLAALRAQTPLTTQPAAFEINSNSHLRQARRKSALRTKSLSPARAVSQASAGAMGSKGSKITSTRQRSASGTMQTLETSSVDLLPARGRRKSVLDEPSNRRFSLNPLQGVLTKRLHQRGRSATSITNPSLHDIEPIRAKKSSANSELTAESVSGAVSPNMGGPNSISEPKPKGRTSTDIAERYQKSIAMLEGRKSEDMTYDVPNPLRSSLSGSQAGKDTEGTTRDHQISMLNQVGSNPDSQPGSEFSLGAPKQFTSRFDPKVASVLSQATPTGMSLQDDLEQSENRSLRNDGKDEDDGGADDFEVNDDKNSATEMHIYDEHGRIRFPASLKPLVLIMPIPLTPAQPEPEEVQELDLEAIAAEEAAQAEKAKLEEIQRLKNVRPAGKLYGRSLIDELNSRKGNQKSKQMAFGANPSAKMFNQHLSPEDASRPGSIYSAVDVVPEVRVTLPNSSSSPMHLANQALQTTQSKFNQALINSSKARKSVFGMDMIMKAELEKLKKIKAMEEQELREEESKIEAKEAKKQAKRKGKKKAVDEDAKTDELKDQINNRLSRMDNWDALLERETGPPPIREPIAPTPLPVLLSPVNQSENLVSNMSDWFEDKANESLIDYTPIMPPSLDFEEDVGFGNVDSLARKLEMQVEEMKYKPLPNRFENHGMVRANSVQSQAALLSLATRGNTPSLLMASPRGVAHEDDEEGEELLLNIIPENSRQSLLPRSTLQPCEELDDNVPLSYRRKSNLLKADADSDEEDDNRPLSHIGTKLMPGMAQSPIRSASSHESDEELPLGIRASILLSKKHPPIDLTHDGASSEGPIGSGASDESDMVPLGIRASTFLPTPSQAARPSGVSSSSHEDNIPLAYRASRMGLHALQGQHSGPMEILASSGHSIGGQSDDVPLAARLYNPSRPSTVNPTFSFHFQAAAFNNPYQTTTPRLFANQNQPRITTINDDGDEDDNVPLAQRASALPPAVGVDSKDDSLRLDVGSDTSQNIDVTPLESEESRLEFPERSISQKREPSKLRSPIPSQVVDESVAREDTLAALEGRGNLEAHADDDVPLGVTRAAHSSTGTLQRERTMIKRQKEKARKLEAAKAKAELEALTSAQKQTVEGKNTDIKLRPQEEQAKKEKEEDDDDDDVPLGMNAHASVMNLASKANAAANNDDEEEDDIPLGISRHTLMMNPQEAMMRKLVEQQNAAFGFPLSGPNHPTHHFQNHMSMMMCPPHQAPFFQQQQYQFQVQQQQQHQQQQQQQGHGADTGSPVLDSSTISRWRQDIQ
ncbi:NuA4 histone H4 acetyltransferase complex and the SWR1 complex subunit [Puccinia graminis f. sp. tritici]|uniref:NuA4 histone H4 acetyltransferase complex and the SWR1 complex subunit n=1 Tax=Puccinia graminis f. sp. tritici TaxID=56615 RepID=A0A5B0NJS6_PUCGR|nr:NuA4 histone H4 acetyltransferase complex and the SWR1 complex subunit [Puccinia graminis f. sp. tritici]